MFNVQCSIKNRVRADDLVKTPVSHDKGAPCCCNPPALLLSRRILWPAIGKGNSPNEFVNVEYPDLCGTTRLLGAKIQQFSGMRKAEGGKLLYLVIF